MYKDKDTRARTIRRQELVACPVLCCEFHHKLVSQLGYPKQLFFPFHGNLITEPRRPEIAEFLNLRSSDAPALFNPEVEGSRWILHRSLPRLLQTEPSTRQHPQHRTRRRLHGGSFAISTRAIRWARSTGRTVTNLRISKLLLWKEVISENVRLWRSALISWD